MENARKEAEAVLFDSVRDVLREANLHPRNVRASSLLPSLNSIDNTSFEGLLFGCWAMGSGIEWLCLVRVTLLANQYGVLCTSEGLGTYLEWPEKDGRS